MEPKVQELKDKINTLNEADLKDFLKDKADNWKELFRQNVEAQTEVYEKEDELIPEVQGR